MTTLDAMRPAFPHLSPSEDDPVQSDLAANAYWKPVLNRPGTYSRKTYGAETFCAIVTASDPRIADTTIGAGIIVSLTTLPSEAAWKRAWMRFRQEVWPQVAAKVPVPTMIEVELAQNDEDLKKWADSTLHVHATAERAVTKADLQALKYKLSGSHNAEPFPTPGGYEAEIHVLPSSASSSVGLFLRISHWHTDGPASLTVLRTLVQLVLEGEDASLPRCDGSEARLLLPAMPALISEDLRPAAKDHDALVTAQVGQGMTASVNALEVHFPRPYPPPQWGHTLHADLTLPSPTVESIRSWATGNGVAFSHVAHAAWALALVAQNPAALTEATTLSNFLAVDARRTFPEGLQRTEEVYQSCTTALMLLNPIGKIALQAAATGDLPTAKAALLSHPRLLLSLSLAIKDSYSTLSTPARAASGYLVAPFAERLFAFMAAGAQQGQDPPLPRSANLVADGKYEHHIPREIRGRGRGGRARAHIEALLLGINMGGRRSQFPLNARWGEYHGEVNLSAEANEAVFQEEELRAFLGDWRRALVACCGDGEEETKIGG